MLSDNWEVQGSQFHRSPFGDRTNSSYRQLEKENFGKRHRVRLGQINPVLAGAVHGEYFSKDALISPIPCLFVQASTIPNTDFNSFKRYR